MDSLDLSFYQGKRVLVTGHTGFKGAWLSEMLLLAGAEVTGYALEPPTEPSVFSLLRLSERMKSVIGDVRYFSLLWETFREVKPEIVLHLAAQPIVRASYEDPRYTFETNVMGTVNVLECIRQSDTVRSFVNITTDKVYENEDGRTEAFREEEKLDGYDPYSNSKSCSELVTHSYRRSFFSDGLCAISTARAGNVIGGGDFARDRIIPDCVRAAQQGAVIAVRNPCSVRPYQHVLEPLVAYLMIAKAQYQDCSLAGSYNIGPDEEDCWQTRALVNLFTELWQHGLTWKSKEDAGPHEASYLKLNCCKMKDTFGWRPRWNLRQAMWRIVDWYQCYLNGGDVRKCTDEQIEEFLSWKE